MAIFILHNLLNKCQFHTFWEGHVTKKEGDEASQNLNVTKKSFLTDLKLY